MYTLPRTGSKGDGLACFVKDGIDVLDRQVNVFQYFLVIAFLPLSAFVRS